MKLAWLCYPNKYEWDEDEDYDVTIVFKEPARYLYSKVVPVVYAELTGGKDE